MEKLITCLSLWTCKKLLKITASLVKKSHVMPHLWELMKVDRLMMETRMNSWVSNPTTGLVAFGVLVG